MRRLCLNLLLIGLMLVPLQTWAVSANDIDKLKESLSPDIKGCFFFMRGLNLLHKSGFLRDALHELTKQSNLAHMLQGKDDQSLFWQQGMRPFLDEMAFLYALSKTSVHERWLKWALWHGFKEDYRHPQRSLYRREKLISDRQLIDALPAIEADLMKAIRNNGHCASTHIRSMYLRWVHGEMYPVWRRLGFYLFSRDVLEDEDTIQRMRRVLEALMHDKDLPEVTRRSLSPEDVRSFQDRVVSAMQAYDKAREAQP